MIMKKVFLMLVVAAAMFAFTACGGGNSPKSVAEEAMSALQSKNYDKFVVKGEEFVGIVPAAGLVPDGAYDTATDIQYYQDPPKHGGAVLHDGDFVIVPPEDAHRPNCQANGPCLVRKIVVKVKV